MKKPALMLNSLDGCGRCGVERRFRLRDGVMSCEVCELPLSEARLAAPINPPPAPVNANAPSANAAASGAREPHKPGSPW